VLQLGTDYSVRPAQALVQDLEQVLGSGTVQLIGDGSRRLKRLEQQRLFKEDAGVEGSVAQPASEEQVAAELDEDATE
jgi:hypothetical protein